MSDRCLHVSDKLVRTTIFYETGGAHAPIENLLNKPVSNTTKLRDKEGEEENKIKQIITTNFGSISQK